ncbi:hypothetical protein BDR26DRAFT_930267 [Obelidium mucronatum]|nr:hypothetical protein BDR26DRAFT_930267 [Obelidium mucronatum]
MDGDAEWTSGIVKSTERTLHIHAKFLANLWGHSLIVANNLRNLWPSACNDLDSSFIPYNVYLKDIASMGAQPKLAADGVTVLPPAKLSNSDWELLDAVYWDPMVDNAPVNLSSAKCRKVVTNDNLDDDNKDSPEAVVARLLGTVKLFQSQKPQPPSVPPAYTPKKLDSVPSKSHDDLELEMGDNLWPHVRQVGPGIPLHDLAFFKEEVQSMRNQAVYQYFANPQQEQFKYYRQFPNAVESSSIGDPSILTEKVALSGVPFHCQTGDPVTIVTDRPGGKVLTYCVAGQKSEIVFGDFVRALLVCKCRQDNVDQFVDESPFSLLNLHMLKCYGPVRALSVCKCRQDNVDQFVDESQMVPLTVLT